MVLLLSPGLIVLHPALAAQRQGQNLSPTQQAQEVLQAKGLYQGGIDGIIGPKTQAALRKYQAQKGLPVTGQLDARTLASLTGGGSSSAQASQADALLSTRQIQHLLQAKGLYRGTIDGIAGPETDAALRQFQRDNGLKVTGTPDAATLTALAPNQASQTQAATSSPTEVGTASQAGSAGNRWQSSGSGGQPSSIQSSDSQASEPQSSATSSQGSFSAGSEPAQSTAVGSSQRGSIASPTLPSGSASAGSQSGQKTSSQVAGTTATQQPAQQAASISAQREIIPGVPLPPGGLPPAVVQHLAQTAPAAEQQNARVPAHGPVLPSSVDAAQLPPSLRKLAQHLDAALQ